MFSTDDYRDLAPFMEPSTLSLCEKLNECFGKEVIFKKTLLKVHEAITIMDINNNVDVKNP